ncbi:SDR family oxidoreductase [Streptomyces sp. NPDC059853]|uniref:SDR family oxidoreductase n=1 Tax=Streptomyces sp. NPDC059853 TaxID=3346973 RepID=UPI00364E586F
MAAPILVTGGTGTLGRHVVPLLRDAGQRVRVLSRHEHPGSEGVEYVTADLLADEGVERAVAGVGTILHLAGGPKGDVEATRNLVRAAAEAGARHLVLISVIGADRVPVGYFRMKHGTEAAVAASGIPWTALRAAQFHDLVLMVLRKTAKLPAVPAPRQVRLEPVDARDVAARLAGLALGDPAGLVPDLPGPTVYAAPDLVRSYLRATGTRRPVLPFPLPPRAGRVYRTGGNLAPEGVTRGTRSWEDFLHERVSA